MAEEWAVAISISPTIVRHLGMLGWFVQAQSL